MSTEIQRREEWYAHRYGVNAVPAAQEAYYNEISLMLSRRINLQPAEYRVTILTPNMPVLHDTSRYQIQHPTQRIVFGEARLAFGNLTEQPV